MMNQTNQSNLFVDGDETTLILEEIAPDTLSFTSIPKVEAEVNVTEDCVIVLDKTANPSLDVVGDFVNVPIPMPTPEYRGSYKITPTTDTQTILVKGLKMAKNLTVEPIPQNYGLITWNGSTLTVS